MMCHLSMLLTMTAVISLAFYCTAADQYNRNIYIDPTVENDSDNCITSNSSSNPCKSLNWAFQTKHRNNSTQYVLLNGPLALNNPVVTFANLYKIAFVGIDLDTSIYCTGESTGLTFIDTRDVVFINITFVGCSSERNSTSRNFTVSDELEFVFSTVQVSLYFYHCRNVSMTNVTVDSPGSSATGVIMYDSDGTVTITNSTFKNCTMDSKRPGGGGFYVEFSYCVPGDTQCRNNSEISYESRNSASHYHFSNCTFSNNVAENVDKTDTFSTYIIPYRSAHEAFGRGGGLSFYLKGNATGNTFSISNCTFDSNRALWGAGLFVELQDDASNNTFVVSQSRFTNNKCHLTLDYGTDGGGMRLSHYIYHPKVGFSVGNNATVVDCRFENNVALNGGGLSIFPARQQSSIDLIANISIISTMFFNNVAKLGAGIHISAFSIFTVGHMPNVIIKNCSFVHNNVDYVHSIDSYQGQPYQVGIGAVYVNEIELIFQEKVNFTDNSGSALVVVGTSANFSNCKDATFTRNTGNNGGAIALLGAAYILVGEETKMNFNGNTATSEGGAIYNNYIERENLKSYTNCFIRYEDPFCNPTNWSAKFIFQNNCHHNGIERNAIYSSSFRSCSRAGGNGISNHTLFCLRKLFQYDDPDIYPNCTDYLTSDVGSIVYIGTDIESNATVTAIPGAPFSLPVKIRNELGNANSVSKTVFAVSTNSSINSTLHEDISKFAYFWGVEMAVLKGGENENVKLKLDSIGDRVWHFEVTVDLQSCPPGFVAINESTTNEEKSCNCPQNGSYSYNGALFCDYGLFRSFLKNYYWMGKIEEYNNSYVVGRCPPGFCNISHTSSIINLPSNNEMLQKIICHKINRTDTLCSRCIEDYGPAVNSMAFECVYCNESDSNVSISSNIAKYVASVYLPLFFMFTILILFDIRLTTGPANAFILYCQVVASTFDLDADGQIPLDRITNNNADKLLNAYRVPYGIFNLEFFENFLPSLCLGTKFNHLSVFLLDYMVAFSPLLMILLVMVCVKLHACIAPKCCKTNVRQWDSFKSVSLSSSYRVVGEKLATRNRRINKAILPAFAAFLLLSYTKFSTVSSYLVRYQQLYDESGTPVSTVVYYAGHFQANDKHYLIYYCLPAIIILTTFVFLPPLLLLDYPLRAFEWAIGKVDCLWRFYPVDKIHVFLDTFQGCYKNKTRFFAGLYFVFRLVINVSFVVTHTWLEQFVVQQLACTIMIVLLAVFQPYNEENKIFNFVDSLIFANLAALNALSFYMYSFYLYNPSLHPPTATFALQYLLVFLPLFYMLSYIIWSLTKPHQQQLKTKARAAMLAVYLKVRGEKYEQLQSVARNTGVSAINSFIHEEASGAEIEGLLNRAEMENTYKPAKPHHLSEEKRNATNSEDSSLRSSTVSSPLYYGSTDSSKDSGSK